MCQTYSEPVRRRDIRRQLVVEKCIIETQTMLHTRDSDDDEIQLQVGFYYFPIENDISF